MNQYGGFSGPGFGIGGAKRVASVTRCQKLPPCPIQPVSPMEHISSGGSTSGIMYLSRGKNLHSGDPAGERSESM